MKSSRLRILRKSKLIFILSLLILGITLNKSMLPILPVYAQGTEIYMDPVNNPPATPSVGYKWNITVYLKNVTDLNSYEVRLYYNKTAGINVTRAWRPTWDSTWVFYGRTTVGLPAIIESWNATHNRVIVGDTIMFSGGSPFSGTGKLAVIEFQIIAAPAKGELLTTPLTLDHGENILLDPDGVDIVYTATDGTYSWAWQPPTTQPYLAVNPTLVEYGPYPPSAIGQAFNINVSIRQLDALWELTNATFTLTYNTTVIDVVGGVANITLNTADWNGVNNVTVTKGTPDMINFTVLTNKTLSGNVSIATIKFTVMNQSNSPPYPSGYFDSSNLTLIDIKLMNHAIQIPADPPVNGLVKIYALVPLPPPSLVVEPQSYTALYPGEVFTINVTIRNLHEGWRAIGAQFRLLFNSSLVEVLNATEGPFFAQFNQTPTEPYTFSAFFVESNGLYGPHVVGFVMVLPNNTGSWNPPFPSGNGTVATITFNVTGSPPGSFFMTLNDTKIIDDNNIEIGHNLTHGYFELPGLNVTITQQPATLYERTETATMKFQVQYPNGTQREGTYFTADDLGTITVGVYNGSKYVTNLTLTTADFDPATNNWTVSWKIPWNATLSSNYTFTIYANKVIDKLGSSGPPADVSSSTFEVTKTTLSVPSISADKASYKRGSWVTIFFQAFYPDNAPVTTGRATIVITRPDGTWAQNLTASYISANGRFEARFWLADNEQSGTWTAKLAANDLADGASPPNTGPTVHKQTTFTTIQTKVLDIQIDVGTTYFKGENSSFIILTILEGQLTNATTITSTLVKPDGTTTALSPTLIGTGTYKATYTILATDPEGSYTIIVEASYTAAFMEASGTALKSFLVSSTLTDWNARLNDLNATIVSINGNLVTIDTSLGQINATLDDLNATIVSINGNLVTIDTSIGRIETTLDTIEGSVDTIEGDTATVKTTLGEVQTSLGGLQSIATTGLAAASILSAIAAIVAILVLLQLRKK